jgi:hypothetical protein
MKINVLPIWNQIGFHRWICPKILNYTYVFQTFLPQFYSCLDFEMVKIKSL